MTAPILSRSDIEQIAQKILSVYTEAYVPEKHLCYQVEPEKLADVLGLEVDYQILSLDGSILGVTSPDEQFVTIYMENEGCLYYLDGNTILIDGRLCLSPRNAGRKNYTLAHEISHQVLYKAFPGHFSSAQQLMYHTRKKPKEHRTVTDWAEWQADALAAALLMPEHAIREGMFLVGLGEHIGTLSKKYTPNKYESFCRLAEVLGASKSALSFRMEQLGLLDRNLLYKQ